MVYYSGRVISGFIHIVLTLTNRPSESTFGPESSMKASRTVSFVLLGIIVMPSPRTISSIRKSYKRLFHHAGLSFPPGSGAAAWGFAGGNPPRRRPRKPTEMARIARARRELEALDESNLVTYRAAADPADDDKIQRKRRRGKMKDRFWSLENRSLQPQPDSNFLVMLRLKISPAAIQPGQEAELLPHLGSGPCHSIPRPREGTVCKLFPNLDALA